MAYARANEQYQKALYRQLRVLEKSKVVRKIWYDGAILAGQQWDVEIKKNLAASQIILFLISADFMASDYIMEEEYPKALYPLCFLFPRSGRFFFGTAFFNSNKYSIVIKSWQDETKFTEQ
ncbi:MAG: hypothetical protein AAF849_09470 [Bacteroidota bacterium]